MFIIVSKILDLFESCPKIMGKKPSCAGQKKPRVIICFLITYILLCAVVSGANQVLSLV